MEEDEEEEEDFLLQQRLYESESKYLGCLVVP